MIHRAMKALSMTQPWASLFLTPEKQWETRSRRILFRGWLAIHASLGFPRSARLVCAGHPFREALARSLGVEHHSQLPVGKIIGVVRIIGCAETRFFRDPVPPAPRGMHEEHFGDFTYGRFAWQREPRVYRLPEPVPCKGALGLWDLPRDVEDAVVAQLRRLTGDGEWPPRA